MTRRRALGALLGALMAAAALASRALTPAAAPDPRARIDLARMVPAAFAGWRVDPSLAPVQADPALQRSLDGLYNQTLSRTYVDRAGQRVMLSMAYGGNQTGNLEMHKPEQCYAAQGFAVSRVARAEFRSRFGRFPLTRLVADADRRHEPVSYWMTVGRRTIKDGAEQKLQKLRALLTGVIPDGMLVRVSTIGDDDTAAFRAQDAFVNDLLAALDRRDRARVVSFLDSPRTVEEGTP